MSSREVLAMGDHVPVWSFLAAVFVHHARSVGWEHGLSGLVTYKQRSSVKPDVDVGPRMSGRGGTVTMRCGQKQA